MSCAVGTYQNEYGKTGCLPCPAGRYNNELGQAECLPCSGGKYASKETSGALTDDICDMYAGPGEYAPPGSTEAFKCESGTYQPTDSVNREVCIPCPQGYEGKGNREDVCAGILNCEYGITLEASCKPMECVCDNGNAAVGIDCNVSGANICESCVYHHKLDSKNQCIPKECICTNGVAVAQELCADEGENCESGSCNPGYHNFNGRPLGLSAGWMCVANECHCDNGIGATGVDCEINGSNICASCNDGFHFKGDDSICYPNICICDNGDAIDDDCPEDQAHVCGSCYDGFDLEHSLDGPRCVKNINICNCDNGIAPTGPDCPVDGKYVCESCVHNYKLYTQCLPYFECMDICVPKECICTDGNAVAQEACNEEGEHCLSCDPGFDTFNGRPQGLSAGWMCVLNDCYCHGGIAATGAECDPRFRDGANVESYTMKGSDHPSWVAHICGVCNAGFHLDSDNKKCIANECHCDNGNAVTEAECLTHEAHACAFCDPGFSVDQDLKCKQNECHCDGGTAATGANCDVNGANICASCNLPHYHVDSNIKNCVQNICKCEHEGLIAGTESVGSDCEIHDSNDCYYCAKFLVHDKHHVERWVGYELHGQICSPIYDCHCQFGDPVNPPECTFDGENCKSGTCHDGYKLQKRTYFGEQNCFLGNCHTFTFDYAVCVPE